MTRQKQLIIDILKNSEGHMTADEIYMEAKKRLPKIAVGTVYRNLNILSADKIINRVAIGNGSDIFDKTPSQHPHMICENCGKVFDLPEEVIDYKKIESEGNKVISCNLTVKCLCKDCKKDSNLKRAF